MVKVGACATSAGQNYILLICQKAYIKTVQRHAHRRMNAITDKGDL